MAETPAQKSRGNKKGSAISPPATKAPVPLVSTPAQQTSHSVAESVQPAPPELIDSEAPRTAEPERIPSEDAALENEARSQEPEPVHADPERAASPNQYLRAGIPPMFVVMIAPELSPVAKIGGLADVVYGLSRELEIRGNPVEIILPKYDCMRWDHVWGLTPVHDNLWVPWSDGAIHCTVFFGFVHGRRCFFIEPHSRDRFFERGKVYGEPDDVLRFAFFTRAAMEFLFRSGKHPDIIHCHDWQTALAPVFLYEIYQPMGMRRSRACFTIHNFRHQGIYGESVLRATGLDRPEYYLHPDRLGTAERGKLNLMKGGIVYSNYVNTVSPTYAGEAKERHGAFGLEPLLQKHHVKYGGILNGIDYEVWNPETDPHIAERYTAATLEKKYENKRALRRRLLMRDNERPLVAYVGRLDAQKGLDLVRHALFYCVNHGAQFVLLGAGSEPAIDDHFRRIRDEINDNPDSHLEIGFDEELSHLIYAGADMIIVPSRFEPCGLTQLIAMRYGTVPVVRAVGGLSDTVFDKDHAERPLHERNGYVFHRDDLAGIESALARAISCFYMFPRDFRHLMRNAMKSDYSWNVPGQHYLNVYDYIRVK